MANDKSVRWDSRRVSAVERADIADWIQQGWDDGMGCDRVGNAAFGAPDTDDVLCRIAKALERIADALGGSP